VTLRRRGQELAILAVNQSQGRNVFDAVVEVHPVILEYQEAEFLVHASRLLGQGR